MLCRFEGNLVIFRLCQWFGLLKASFIFISAAGKELWQLAHAVHVVQYDDESDTNRGAAEDALSAGQAYGDRDHVDLEV